MDKQHWQVLTGVLGMAAVGLGFALIANRSVLAQERNDRTPCTATEPETVVIRAEAPVVYGLPIPDAVSCNGGVYLIRTEHGMESLLKDGKAMRCSR